MPLPRPARPDALRPTAESALQAWAVRVRADREQVERCREVADPSDFYAPVADRFRQDPLRTDEPALDVLRSLARPSERWLDLGAGGGRYALPLALAVREVCAVEPSAGMLEVLREGAAAHGIPNVRVLAGRWPESAGEAGRADISLMAHVGYDIEHVGPFLDAMEAATVRLCVAVMGEGAMTTAAALFWQPVHGEPRVALPALPELLAVLVARGRLPEVAIVPRQAPTFESLDDLLTMVRRQLWVRPGSPRDERLVALAREVAERLPDGTWRLESGSTRIGIVTWSPLDGEADPLAAGQADS
jgi:SAM-dependent methyltransferase